jgi:hypothetical protein
MNMKKGMGATLLAASALALSMLPSAHGAVTGENPTEYPGMNPDYAPLVHWALLQNVGLTGEGVTVEIDSPGLKGLQDDYDSGLLDPSQMTIEFPDSVGNNNHATSTAEVIHQIAPQADMYICNETTAGQHRCHSDYLTGEPQEPHGDVVVVNAVRAFNSGFAYGDAGVDALSQTAVVPQINAYPDTLFYVSGTDYYGVAYTQGDWIPMQASVGGETETVWNIGKAAGGEGAPALTLSNGFIPPDNGGKTAENRIYLLATAQNAGDDPAWRMVVYDAQGEKIMDTGEPDRLPDNECGCSRTTAVIPGVTEAQMPLNLYVMQAGGTITGDVKLKLFGGEGGGEGFSYDWSPITTGSVDTQMVGAGPNGIMVTAACPETDTENDCPFRGALYDTMGIGPLLALNITDRTWRELHYPTLAGDDPTPVFREGAPLPVGGSSGTSGAAPELGAVAALLHQAGLTTEQIIEASEATARYPDGSVTQGEWAPKMGYGAMQPLAILKQYVTLPSPAIDGPAQVDLSVGEAHDFKASCTPAPNASTAGFVWDFDDGEHGDTRTVTHKWAKAGSYTLKANCAETLEDGRTFRAGHPAQVTVDVEAAPAEPPVAGFDQEQVLAEAGHSAAVKMSCSPGSESLSGWELDFGDGHTTSGSLSGTEAAHFSVDHTWAKAGAYSANLICTDSTGTDSDMVRLSVAISKASGGDNPPVKNPPGGGGGGGGSLGWLALLGLLGLALTKARNRQ